MPQRPPGAQRAIAVTVALAIAMGGATPGIALSVGQAPGASCIGGWTVTYPPSMLGATAVDVTYLGTKPWLAGSAVIEARRPSAFTAVGSSAGWTTVTVPPTSENSVLAGISGAGRDRLWAVGELVGSRTQPLIQLWNGSHWQPERAPELRFGGALTDVSQVSAGPAIAVGYAADLVGQHPLALRLSKGAWLPDSPVVAGQASLTGIASAPDGTTWAVGWVSAESGLRPLLERWIGSRWRRATMRGTGIAALSGVVVTSATDAWAVGYRHGGGALRALAVHWDGKRWSVDDSLDVPAGGGSVLRDVAIVGGEPVAVGSTWDRFSTDTDPLIAQRHNGTWDLSLHAGGISGGELLGIDSGRQVAAVGRSGDVAMAMAPCGASQAGLSAGPSSAPDAGHSSFDLAAAPPRATAGVSGFAALGSGGGGPAGPINVHGLEVRDVTAAAGLSKTTLTYTGNAADFNGDGWMDLVIGRHGNPLWVLQNTGQGGFVEPAPSGYRKADRHGCSVGDVNGDGRPDIFCAVGANLGLSIKQDEVWLDPFNPAATNQAGPLGVSDPLGRGRRTAIFDANHDGRMDLYVTNDPSRADGLPSMNRLFINTGNGFRSGPGAGLDLGVGGQCLVPADLDRDGWTDLVVCEYIQMAGFSALHIFHNDHGRFVDTTQAMGLTTDGDVDAQVADMNGDGTPDLVRLSGHRIEVDLQRGGVFTRGYYLPVSAAQTVTLADVNGDGAPDIYVQRGERGATIQDVLLLNDGSGRGYTSVTLPVAQPGVGGGAVAIDYDRNGRQDLLVMHGNNIEHGPIQLLAFGPPWPFSAVPSPSPSPSSAPSLGPDTTPGPAGTPAPSVEGTPVAPSPSFSATHVVPSPTVTSTPAPNQLPPAASSDSDQRRVTAVLSGGAIMLGALALLAVLLPLLRDRRRGHRRP